jgi:hypothetical protein
MPELLDLFFNNAMCAAKYHQISTIRPSLYIAEIMMR